MHAIPAPDQAEWWSKFQALLDDQNEWPSAYLFKFIVPRPGLDELRLVFGGRPTTVRASTKGRYVSVTAKLHMASSDEVIRIYKAAGQTEGVISL